MSNTQRTPQQFKPNDRVRVGAPLKNDPWGSSEVAKEGAIGIVQNANAGTGVDVQFMAGDPLVTKCGDWKWIIHHQCLTLVDEKPVEPTEPLPIMARDMTLRQYAAITLRVPDSGTPWLDEMIRKSLHDWFAGQALVGILAHPQSNELGIKGCIESAADAATAMMERRAEK